MEKWTGIPVCVGLAPTKTLAKIAARFAKKYAGYNHCCLIDDEEKRIKAIKLSPIEEVWGIGRRFAARMSKAGIHSAYDFTKLTKQYVQKDMGISGLQTWQELQGISCIDFKPSMARKTITVSRSFHEPITDLKPFRL